MKKIFTLFALFISLSSFSQKVERSYVTVNYKLDYTDPVSVVNGLITACKNKDLKLAFLVFDPFIESGEFYRYRRVYFTNDKNDIDALYDMRNSFTNGPAKISENGLTAWVPMWYKSSHKGDYQERIELNKRYGNWYIIGF